jgi:hypothetical protein
MLGHGTFCSTLLANKRALAGGSDRTPSTCCSKTEPKNDENRTQ